MAAVPPAVSVLIATYNARHPLRFAIDLVQRVFKGSAAKLVLQALQTGKASPDELAEIRRLLDAHRAEKNRGGR